MTLDEALDDVRKLAYRIGEHHVLLGAALFLVVRCEALSRMIQTRLLSAAACLVDLAEAVEEPR